jgi:membrane protein required for colicin V production
MTLLDWVCIAVLLVFCFFGFRRRFSGELFRILSFLAGLWAGFNYSSSLTELIKRFLPFLSFTVLRVIVFIVLFVVATGLVFLLGLLVRKVIQLTLLGWMDRIGGVILGAVKGFFIIGFLFWLFGYFPFLSNTLHVNRTKVAKKALNSILWIYHKTNASTGKISLSPMKEWKNKLENELGSLRDIKQKTVRANENLKKGITTLIDSTKKDSTDSIKAEKIKPDTTKKTEIKSRTPKKIDRGKVIKRERKMVRSEKK